MRSDGILLSQKRGKPRQTTPSANIFSPPCRPPRQNRSEESEKTDRKSRSTGSRRRPDLPGRPYRRKSPQCDPGTGQTSNRCRSFCPAGTTRRIATKRQGFLRFSAVLPPRGEALPWQTEFLRHGIFALEKGVSSPAYRGGTRGGKPSESARRLWRTVASAAVRCIDRNGRFSAFACDGRPCRKAAGECPAAVADGGFRGGSLYRQERRLFRFCMRRPPVSESRRNIRRPRRNFPCIFV